MVKSFKGKVMRTSGNVMFSKPKVKKERFARSTYTEEELLEIRKRFNITPKDERDMHGYKGGYQRPL